MENLIATDKDVTDLEVKIFLAQQRIIEWYEHWEGQVYISFSGGKDSTVLAELVWSIYPEVPAVFSNTGLEYPEIVQFVKRKKKQGYPVVIMRPKKTFREVVLEDGFPLISKKVSEMVSRFYDPKPSNAATRHLYLTGFRRDGVFVKGSKLPERWKKLIDAPFKVTASCCDSLKKEPFRRYRRETGRMPYSGVMSSEGGRRGMMKTCNSFDGKDPQSRPMLPWTEDDVWSYIRKFNVEYCEVYNDRYVNGIFVEGEKRAGCMFCAYGAHLEKGENRFQRMAITHPKLWNYCINKLGMDEALDFIGVKYMPTPQKKEVQQDLFEEVKH
ncbi:phosphoadenosine phosphosulfate reductase family protein [Marinomonas atlantica]|uniref:phosphoadenosine phosphosulfate reductase family protein n=1 Tax=Marinomonas atlantica TaxID=1806668 RepID=UPI00083598C1|nr:phosphoadenosine phosphosulfate reductase family protein [Marinomonas atlantica]